MPCHVEPQVTEVFKRQSWISRVNGADLLSQQGRHQATGNCKCTGQRRRPLFLPAWEIHHPPSLLLLCLDHFPFSSDDLLWDALHKVFFSVLQISISDPDPSHLQAFYSLIYKRHPRMSVPGPWILLRLAGKSMEEGHFSQ